jgi:hypothetical protein
MNTSFENAEKKCTIKKNSPVMLDFGATSSNWSYKLVLRSLAQQTGSDKY